MNKEYYIHIFSELGGRLARFGGAEAVGLSYAAVAANPWFTPSEIETAVKAIAGRMLGRKVLEEWLTHYDIDYGEPKRIAIIMAGNIPLVGFSDLLCVLASGNAAYVKTSSKDTVLMSYVMEQLKEIEPSLPVFGYDDALIYDAVIATGSNDTGKYFRTAFAGIPSVIRGSRSSVAVLTGDEDERVLRLLQSDIFTYSGMGCRNVSMIFVPDDYDAERTGRIIAPAADKINRKYYNNYLSVKAKLLASGVRFVDCGTCVLTEGEAFPASLSNIVLRRYSDIRDVYGWIDVHDDILQCVVGNGVRHSRAVGFGEAQSPYPWDYPDGVDILQFLAEI